MFTWKNCSNENRTLSVQGCLIPPKLMTFYTGRAGQRNQGLQPARNSGVCFHLSSVKTLNTCFSECEDKTILILILLNEKEIFCFGLSKRIKVFEFGSVQQQSFSPGVDAGLYNKLCSLTASCLCFPLEAEIHWLPCWALPMCGHKAFRTRFVGKGEFASYTNWCSWENQASFWSFFRSENTSWGW